MCQTGEVAADPGGAAMSYVMFGIFFALCVCWIFYIWWLQDKGHNAAAVVLNILVVITVYFTATYKGWKMTQAQEPEKVQEVQSTQQEVQP
jgi:hypothetical protein